MEEMIFVYCDKCQSSINPSSAFVKLSETYKCNIQQLKLDHARELQEAKMKRDNECNLMKHKIEQYETAIRGQEKIHESLIMEYEDKISGITKKLDDLQDVEETIKDMQLDIDRFQLINKNNRGELDDMKTYENELEEENTKLKEFIASGDIEKIKEINEQLLVSLLEKDAEITNIKDGRKAMEERALFYMNERDTFREDISSKTKEVINLTAKLNESILEIERLSSELNTRILERPSSPKDWSELKIEIEKQKRLIETKLKLEYEKDINRIKDECEKNIADIKDEYKKSTYQIGNPLEREFISSNISALTIDYLKDGAQGISRFIEHIYTNPEYKANYVCVDMDKLKFKYLDKHGKWNTDKNCKYLKKVIYPFIEEKCKQILTELKISPVRNDELIGSIMNTLAKVEHKDKSFHNDLMRFLAPLISKH